ncbi:MAG: hypothetical protein V1725_04590 [archaeon]
MNIAKYYAEQGSLPELPGVGKTAKAILVMILGESIDKVCEDIVQRQLTEPNVSPVHHVPHLMDDGDSNFWHNVVRQYEEC